MRHINLISQAGWHVTIFILSLRLSLTTFTPWCKPEYSRRFGSRLKSRLFHKQNKQGLSPHSPDFHLSKVAEKCVRETLQPRWQGVQALFIDFSNVFDLLKPDILANKLLSMRINPSLITLVLSFLSQRTQCVRHQTSRSPYLPVTLGVTQGTFLGLTLWNIYALDLDSGDKVIEVGRYQTLMSI